MSGRAPEFDARDRLFRQLLINGNLDLSQRNDFTVTGLGSSEYTSDRLLWNATSGVYDYANTETSFSGDALTGWSVNRATQITATTTPTVTSSVLVRFDHNVEGFDFQQLKQSVGTLAFNFKAVQVGTYSVAFRNSATDEAYVSEFVVTDSDTWKRYFISVPFVDASGTWLFDENIGLRITWPFTLGTDFETSNLNQWLSGNLIGSSNQVNAFQSISDHVAIAAIQLYEGYSRDVPFVRAADSISQEIAMAERYYEKSMDIDVAPNVVHAGMFFPVDASGYANTATVANHLFRVRKRISPTVTLRSPLDGSTGNFREFSPNQNIAGGVTPAVHGFRLQNASGGAITGNTYSYGFEADADFT